MSEDKLQRALATLRDRIGESTAPSDWFEVTQEHIDRFADLSMDHQWIHVDVERARRGPFGAPIAHGDLTLSLMRHLPGRQAAPGLEEARMGINYGFDRIRFPAPVPAGTRIRAFSTLRRAEIKNGMLEAMNEFTVEIEGRDKPAVVAEFVSRWVF